MFNFQIVLFIFIGLSGLYYSRQVDQEKAKKHFIYVMLALLVLESCLRGISIGSDTWKYRELFVEAGVMSWQDVFDAIIDRYVYHLDDRDAGYIIFQKLIYTLTHSFQFFLFCVAICFFIPLGMLLQRLDLDLQDLIFLFIFYVGLFNPIAMSGTRKAIALGISILCLMKYNDKKYKQAIIWFVLGFTIHMSILAIILIPAMNFLSSRKIKIIHALSFLSIPVVIAASGSILLSMARFVENEHYEDYAQMEASGGGMTFVALMELLLLFLCIMIKKDKIDDDKLLKLMYCALPIATFFVPLITNNGSMIRISQYFHIYVLFLLPYTIRTYFLSMRSTIYVLFSIILIILCLLGTSQVSEYYFFWNDPYQNNIAPLL